MTRYRVTFITEAEPDRWRVHGISTSRPLAAEDLEAVADALVEQMGAGVALIDCELVP